MDCPNCKSSQTLITSVNKMQGLTTYVCNNCSYTWAVKEPKVMKYVILQAQADRKFFASEHQAQVVAEKMARDHKCAYYVAELLLKATPVEVPVEVTRVE